MSTLMETVSLTIITPPSKFFCLRHSKADTTSGLQNSESCYPNAINIFAICCNNKMIRAVATTVEI